LKGILVKWAKRLGLGAAVLLALLAALPLFISVDDYRPSIEREISARLKEPVTITRLRAFALPSPHVTAEGIAIGKTGDVKVAKLVIAPEVWSLLSEIRVIRYVGLSGVQITQSGIDKLAVLGKGDGKAPSRAGVRVKRVNVDDATLLFEKNKFGPFEAVIALNERSEPEQISITTSDGKFKAGIKPVAERYAVDVSAKSWLLPLGMPLIFDELKVTGMATLNDLNLSRIDARLYGGTVGGNATLAWARGAQLRATLDVRQVDIAALAALMSQRSPLSGRLAAKPVVSANSAGLGQLGAALRIETPFQVHNGVLRGVDIKKAATNLLLKDSSGETHFDQLSGYLVMERGTQRFSNLKVMAGALSADGNVTIAPNKTLSGRVNAQVGTNAVASATVPLNVSGTLDAPILLPTGASLAGAAVGTAILGPTVGTSVGAKVGNWAESLFGGKK
jgi:uncharacterized protein involved in outer membrane biogenesis